MNIVQPVSKLIAQDPKVVISIGTSMPTVKLINQFFEQGYFGTRFFGIDSTFLAKEILHYKGAPLRFTSSVPDPITSQIPLAQNYRKHLTQYFPDQDHSILSFAYYASAAILCTALMQSHMPLANSDIITHIESLKKSSIQGFQIDFDPSNRHVFGKKIWLI